MPPGRKPLAATTIAAPNTERKESQPLARDDVRLNAFLTKIYTTTGWGILGMFGSAQLLTATGLAFSVSPLMLAGGGMLTAVGSSMALTRMRPVYEITGGNARVAVDPPARQAAFAGCCVGFGMMTAPMFAMVSAVNPTVIPAAAVAALGTMSGAGLYALNAKGDSINAWGPALTGSLLGLIGVGVGGIAASYLGYPQAAAALHSVSTYGGVIVFAGLTAYDTKVAVDMHAAGEPDHLLAASQLFMNFSNLFTRFMHIFGAMDD